MGWSSSRGTVLNLGADWCLTDARGAIPPDAQYDIRTMPGWMKIHDKVYSVSLRS
ncbi:hypothetical protein BKA70DRAFT_1249969 [Coprinopsis sp. MPI-PUGE-AT-0042]|nr:hypothetical protein BKA70DRAFT_1249969 [Coprinopsis sp. MPI-PUGE-AT-0042]